MHFYKNVKLIVFMSQVQAIVDHHHPHDGARTTISKVRFVDPSKPDGNEKVSDDSNEVNVFNYLQFFAQLN